MHSQQQQQQQQLASTEVRLNYAGNDHATEMVDLAQDFLVKGLCTDASLSVVEGGTKFSIRCHRVVLAAASPLLSNLLLSSEQNDDDVSIVLSDTSNQELEQLIAYIYTGNVTLTGQHSSFLHLLSTLAVVFENQQFPRGDDHQKQSDEEDCCRQLISDVAELSQQESVPWASWLPQEQAFWSPLEEEEDESCKDLFDPISTVDRSAILYTYAAAAVTDSSGDNSNSGSDTSHAAISDNNSQIQKVPTKKSFQCQQCSKCFSSLHYMRFHQGSVHAEHRLLSCPLCAKSFTGSYYLRQHTLRMHSDSRPHRCPSCAAAFSVRYDLVVHLRTHERVKPFSCPDCPNRYSTGRALREHARTHTGERPFVCGECGRRFALPKTLRVHYRQHSGERPYLCPDCGRTYVQNSTLKNHLRKHHHHQHVVINGGASC